MITNSRTGAAGAAAGAVVSSSVPEFRQPPGGSRRAGADSKDTL
ncbi:MAG TPA: hypothetical protein VGH88_01915 [Streptosporangiaceae bacterium]|jgi:hypothetical protein